jgi:hypothetical protein
MSAGKTKNARIGEYVQIVQLSRLIQELSASPLEHRSELYSQTSPASQAYYRFDYQHSLASSHVFQQIALIYSFSASCLTLGCFLSLETAVVSSVLLLLVLHLGA